MTRVDANAIRQARRARVRLIRQRVVAATVALFIATWVLIAGVLITGHDPALARSASKSAAAGTTSATVATTNSSSSAATSSNSTSATSSSNSSNSTAAGSGTGSVTSSQS